MSKQTARGYIASGPFKGNRAPQHIQNQIVRLYCETQNLEYVLSRAEYSMGKNTDSQLWAALKEGIKHIVFYSVWQLPDQAPNRLNVYKYCLDCGIKLHFAVERIIGYNIESYGDIELLIQLQDSLTNKSQEEIDLLKKILS